MGVPWTRDMVKFLFGNKQSNDKQINKLLIEQLERLEGVLGLYNCQLGGKNCNFQRNCHRLIREEINKLRKSESEEK